MRRLWPFMMGSVALGLDAYVIAGLLPAIAASLNAREASIGLGVAAFTGSYALIGPILAGRAGRASRRSLIGALIVFSVANIVTMSCSSVTIFLASRALAGAAAGIYSPLSSAVATGLVGVERRGRALALILSGLAIGTVFGVPAGLALAQRWGWRAAIALIVVTGMAALLGIIVRGEALPPVPASSAIERLRAVMRPDNLLSISVTLLTGIASLGLYTYLTFVLAHSSLAHHQSAALTVWGIGGAIGALGIGRLLDRGEPLRLSAVLLAGLAVSLCGMSLSHTPAVTLACLFMWGLCGWASLAPQQHILISANPDDSATAVAANASANYLGSALGAGMGALLVSHGISPQALCWSAAGIAALGLACQLARARMAGTR